jgi:N-methylhydantoinase A
MFHALHAAHDSAYGYSYAGEQEVELVNLRVAGVGRLREIPPYQALPNNGSAADAITGTRQVYFGKSGWIETNLYDRARLARASTIIGPAIVEQYDSTTVIFPRHSARVDDHGNLLVTVRVEQETSELVEAEASNR